MTCLNPGRGGGGVGGGHSDSGILKVHVKHLGLADFFFWQTYKSGW